MLYKYLDIKGAKITLQKKSLKFSRATAFNDPFDMQIHDCFGLDTARFLVGLQDSFIKALASSPVPPTCSNPLMQDIYHWLHGNPQNTESIQKELSAETITEEEIKQSKDLDQEWLMTLRAYMDAEGVFCASMRNDSITMWSHYAEHHKGAVLCFSPSYEKDSMFLAGRAVTYSSKRPIFYETPEEFHKVSLFGNKLDFLREKISAVIHTKSPEWEYEQEYRLSIPSAFPEGRDWHTRSFDVEELSEVYLGNRMPENDKLEIILLATAVNPHVKIFQTNLATRAYKLEFVPYNVPHIGGA